MSPHFLLFKWQEGPAITIRTGQCSLVAITKPVYCFFHSGASFLRGNLDPGGYALGSPAGALAGILGDLAHELGHPLVAGLLYRRKPITVHLVFRHIFFLYNAKVTEKV